MCVGGGGEGEGGRAGVLLRIQASPSYLTELAHMNCFEEERLRSEAFKKFV